MENRYSAKRKYSSFLISLLVHLLLIALLVRTAIKLQRALPEKAPFLEKRTIPAQVSFGSPKPPAVAPTVSPTALTSAQSPVISKSELLSEPVLETSSDPVPDTSLLTEELPSVAHSELSPIESGEKQKSEPLALPLSATGTVPQTAQRASSNLEKKRSVKKRRSQLPQGLTGAIFVEAFKQVAQHQGGNGGTGQGYSQGFGSSEGTPEHVQQRLDEWREYTYRKKIFEALVKACKLSKSYVYADTDLKQEFMVRFIISADGTFKVAAPDPITGIKAIDDYLALFFSKIDFPPLPKHLNRDFLVHPITIKLTLHKGLNPVQLQPLND